MKRASYREAIAWIGENDDAASWSEPDLVAHPPVTIVLVADLFAVEISRVVTDVCRFRRTHKIGAEITAVQTPRPRSASRIPLPEVTDEVLSTRPGEDVDLVLRSSR